MEIKEKVLAVIGSQISDIKDKLTESKVKFAECCLNEEEWQIRIKYEKMCKIYEGQIAVLEGLERTLENDIFVIALPMKI
ncbi:MAG TPA: hypothetical protein P5556_09015 [Candidatus Gastranaerophilales bacterium]|nr:hypothetical protein [Candidatus Gastranaerophilales bacterium]